jgi:GNAT superfamily N-acetyltransferase
MSAELVVRPGTPDDTGRILDLVKQSLGEGLIPRESAYWMWKHHANPFGTSPSLLAESEGRLVGLRVFMRWTWQVGGASVAAVRAVDTATHTDWRGKGIFSRLTLKLLDQMKAEGVSFVFNTPNSQSRPGYLKMGWVSMGQTSFWVRPLRPVELIRARMSKRASVASPSAAPAEQGSPVRSLMEQPDLARFLEALPVPPDRFATPRSSDYLRWRYSAVPGFEYRASWRFDGDHGAAVIFRTKRQSPIRELRFCEVLVGDSARSRRLGRQLLRSIARGSDAHVATAMTVTGTAPHNVLIGAGFLPAPRMGPVMTVRPLNAVTGGRDPLQRSSWHLSAGDLELF